MVIIKSHKNNGIIIHTVKQDMTDEQAAKKLLNKFVKPSMIKDIIKEDADVYTDKGELLMRFRKGALPDNHTKAFYDNVIKFALTPTSNRGSATGSKSKSVYDNPKIMTNIFGYFDRFSPTQKKNFRTAGVKLPLEIRECRFNRDFPEMYKETLPLIKDIDTLYEKYTPTHYEKQNKKALQTAFKIPGTSFTTITTNVNFKTSIHTDKGDDSEGFGNLCVIEKGNYSGAETCFPQYGIGVDVRTGDILFMNVHKLHGNLPMKPIDKDARRLSIVCYLREKLWRRSKGKNASFVKEHNKLMARVGGGKNNAMKLRQTMRNVGKLAKNKTMKRK